VGLTEGELRLLGVAMAVAFAGALSWGFAPSLARRRRDVGAVRSKGHLPRGVAAAWEAVPLTLVVGVLAAALTPGLIFGGPLNLLRSSALEVAGAGAAVFGAGAALAGASARHLGAQLTVQIETREGGALITTGPYARVRHPIYTGIILMAWGLALALASPILGAVALSAVACASIRARVEEDMLLQDPVHGPGYRSYVARTGRFLPAFRRDHQTSAVRREP
jgi:protein-S-isoprenylcysteine O-methyltransferase Ste14